MYYMTGTQCEILKATFLKGVDHDAVHRLPRPHILQLLRVPRREGRGATRQRQVRLRELRRRALVGRGKSKGLTWRVALQIHCNNAHSLIINYTAPAFFQECSSLRQIARLFWPNTSSLARSPKIPLNLISSGCGFASTFQLLPDDRAKMRGFCSIWGKIHRSLTPFGFTVERTKRSAT